MLKVERMAMHCMRHQLKVSGGDVAGTVAFGHIKVGRRARQVHIDLSKGMRRIQIFSKSGKDSTSDREGLHRVILESFRLKTADCVIKAAVHLGRRAVDLE